MSLMLGLANGDVPRTLDGFRPELVRRWNELGVRCISVSFTDDLDQVARDGEPVQRLLADDGISVAQLAGVNANLVHADDSVRAGARVNVLRAFDAAAALGATMVLSGCGSNDPDHATHFYAPHPENYTAQSEERLIEELRWIGERAQHAGVLYAIECHLLTTMRTPSVIRRILDAVDSDHVVANFDPVNLLATPAEVYNNYAAMKHQLEVVGPRYGPSCHLKDVDLGRDFVLRIEERAPGEGRLDLKGFLRLAQGLSGRTALIVEHLTPDQVPIALRRVRDEAAALGMDL